MVAIEIHVLNESINHPIMNACDLTDGGRKIFCETNDGMINVLKMSYKLVNIEKFETSVSLILNTRKYLEHENPLHPIFALVKADNGFVGVYWRQNVNQISDGKQIMSYHRFAEIVLKQYSPEIGLNENLTINSISLTIDGKSVLMENLNT